MRALLLLACSFGVHAQVATNPTHYGDPKTGCESDEQAVRVQGLSGDFCSPKCSSSGSCPSDVPKGDSATPECALRTTTGDKYCALICQSDSDCGTGSCQKIMGVGLCTYNATNKMALEASMTQVAVATNPSHYGNPKTGCESDEQAVRVQGLSGDFCSPKCSSSGSCPSDVPKGDSATPECALRTTTGDKYCALICQSDSDCGLGSCEKIMGVGLCTYPASGAALAPGLQLLPSEVRSRTVQGRRVRTLQKRTDQSLSTEDLSLGVLLDGSCDHGTWNRGDQELLYSSSINLSLTCRFR
ncbi:unnamed protein product [Durusdinium trenchii]|uniref:Uncharacterized protein n=1 Tax=Durusdinium trenchii TaxID=1381693 RepID=A0ABP0RA59_9DINO